MRLGCGVQRYRASILRRATNAFDVCCSRPHVAQTTVMQRYLSTSAESLVRVERDVSRKGIFVVTLSNPSELNALTVEMGERFKYVLGEIGRDQSARAVIVTGAGKHVCRYSMSSGLSFLEERTKTPFQQNIEEMKRFYGRYLSVREVPVPVIAAINGAAVGAGLCLAAACDLRIAASDAKMGVNFVKLGLGPGMAATHFLPQLLGPQLASKMILTGELITGARAKEIGLVLDAVPAAEVLDAAIKLANEIAAASNGAVFAALRALRSQFNSNLSLQLQLEAEGQAMTYGQPDILEGLAAVKEKRNPVFPS